MTARELAARLLRVAADARSASSDRPLLHQAADTAPVVVAVDGRSGGGKSTLARLLQAAVPASAVVHTDDVAWHHSFFDWQELLATHVLAPLRAGQPISYRPPGWVAKGRPGAVEVPTGCALVLVEGVGAGRHELSDLVDAVVWVQSDLGEAQRRALVRDVAEGAAADTAAALDFWEEWMREEMPFLAAQRPWERAAAVVAGTAPSRESGGGDMRSGGPTDTMLRVAWKGSTG
ncbi:MAG: uridine kinase family protein [Actinomycetales bacterium]